MQTYDKGDALFAKEVRIFQRFPPEYFSTACYGTIFFSSFKLWKKTKATIPETIVGKDRFGKF